MEKQHMRPLTEQELQTIYGGNIKASGIGLKHTFLLGQLMIQTAE